MILRRTPPSSRRGGRARPYCGLFGLGLAVIAAAFLAPHCAGISSDPPADAPRDLLVIARATVDADPLAGGPPGADLEARIVRALYGFLTA